MCKVVGWSKLKLISCEVFETCDGVVFHWTRLMWARLSLATYLGCGTHSTYYSLSALVDCQEVDGGKQGKLPEIMAVLGTGMTQVQCIRR